MKQIKTIVMGMCLLSASYVTAQVGVGVSGAVNSSAALEVSSTSKGLLPPRLTTTQRDAITTPTNGLVIYNTTTNKFNVRESGNWVEMATKNTNDTFTGNKTFNGTVRMNGGLVVPTAIAEVSFYATTPTNNTIGNTSWVINTTANTNWTILSFPAVGTTLGTNTHLDSSLELGARVNHNNTGAGAGVLAYKGTVQKSFHIALRYAFTGFGTSGTSMDEIVVGIFKNGVLLPESISILPNSTSIAYSFTQVKTTMNSNDYIDVRAIGLTGTAGGTITLKYANFNAIGI